VADFVLTSCSTTDLSSEYFEKRDSKSLDYSNLKSDYIFENNYDKKTMEDFVNQIY
jgi:hypothetical protein